MLESKFQSDLIKELRDLFPGCYILKLDPTYLQGIPDLLILWKNKWAILEVKRNSYSPRQPNQTHYVERFDKMSFSAFIFPENKEQILDELQQSFNSRRSTRIS